MNDLSKTDKKILNTVQAGFKKAINDYGLIEDNDHILVGFSGGKDSLALIELLGERMKIVVPRFRLTAVHISVENIPYKSDLAYLKAHAAQYDIPFVHHTVRFDPDQPGNKSTCFLCSWHRRKALFDLAEKLNCNKIALGHHLDDIAETLLLNLVYQGSFGSMPPKLKMNRFNMTIIRPLALIAEKELIEMGRIRGYQKQIKNCPFEKESSRSKAKELLSELETWNPNVRRNLWAAMENVKNDYLPHKCKWSDANRGEKTQKNEE